MWCVTGSVSSSLLPWTSCRQVVCPFPSFLSLMSLYRTYTRTLLNCRACALPPMLFGWRPSGPQPAFSVLLDTSLSSIQPQEVLISWDLLSSCALFPLSGVFCTLSGVQMPPHPLWPAQMSSSNDKPSFPLIFQVYLEMLWGPDILLSIENTIHIIYISIVISYFWECLASTMSHL